MQSLKMCLGVVILLVTVSTVQAAFHFSGNGGEYWCPDGTQLLFFTTPNCGACKQSYPAVTAFKDANYPVVTIDGSVKTVLAQKYKVRLYPTFLICIKGVAKFRAEGPADITLLQKMFKAVSSFKKDITKVPITNNGSVVWPIIPYGGGQIDRISGPRWQSPHPGCYMCLGLHLQSSHGVSSNVLRNYTFSQWDVIHDNLHNAPYKRVVVQSKNVKAKETKNESLFAPTPMDVVYKMLATANVQKEDVLYDLGCGDGRIVIAAAKKYGCKAVGYDIDSNLITQARENARKAGVENLVRFEVQDILTADVKDATVIALYLFPALLEKLKPQLEKIPGSVRIVAHEFAIPEWEPILTSEMTSTVDRIKHKIYLWVTPLISKDIENKMIVFSLIRSRREGNLVN